MTTEMLGPVSLVVVIAFLCYSLFEANRSIKILVETVRLTLVSVTGKEEAELRRLAMARRMQAPKTQFPTPAGGVTTELLDALKRRPGIRHKGDRQTVVMGSRDEISTGEQDGQAKEPIRQGG